NGNGKWITNNWQGWFKISLLICFDLPECGSREQNWRILGCSSLNQLQFGVEDLFGEMYEELDGSTLTQNVHAVLWAYRSIVTTFVLVIALIFL
ncbi:hypothetical protein, partial [Chryseobacterium sp.]|uniref:hypothetical protein n=1 Tax=Chryseobacterium sp. TaxID=1871047 RepID=UPI003219E44F